MSRRPPIARGLVRNRHGRAVRRPLLSPRMEPGTIRRGGLAEVVDDAMYYLKFEFPGDLDHINVRVRDLPPPRIHGGSIKWSWMPAHNLLTFYRVPMLYSGKRRDPMDEAMRLNWEIIKAVAAVIGRDPKELWDGPR